MGRLFNLDSPLMSGLSKLADLICLNIIALICCIPIFTIGASLTALNYVVLKIVRDEEGYIIKSFFKSFKQNFRQATIIWLLVMLIGLLIIGDFWIIIYSGVQIPKWIMIALLAAVFLLLLSVMHIFPLLSRFDNTIKNTIKNSFLMGILNLPRTLGMIVCWVIPLIIMFYAVRLLPVVLFLGISGPVFGCALLYNKPFKKFEPEEEAPPGDEEWIRARQEEAVREKEALREKEKEEQSQSE